MGNIKDGYEIGVEALQFWLRFKGKRIRVWPVDLVLRLCSESARTADGRIPSWWEDFHSRYGDGSLLTQLHTKYAKYIVDHPTNHLTHPELIDLEPRTINFNIETVEDAKLFEATIGDVIKNPPALYLTHVQYWAVVGDAKEKKVAKVDSQDEAMLWPLNQVARIDFVSPQSVENVVRS
jgi:hypothetical protein